MWMEIVTGIIRDSLWGVKSGRAQWALYFFLAKKERFPQPFQSGWKLCESVAGHHFGFLKVQSCLAQGPHAAVFLWVPAEWIEPVSDQARSERFLQQSFWPWWKWKKCLPSFFWFLKVQSKWAPGPESVNFLVVWFLRKEVSPGSGFGQQSVSDSSSLSTGCCWSGIYIWPVPAIILDFSKLSQARH